MSLLARAQSKGSQGYARDFTDWVWKDNMRALKEKGVKLVTNAGGLDPQACRARMEALAAEAAAEMDERRLNQMLVIDEQGKLVGALHMHDLMAAKVV